MRFPEVRANSLSGEQVILPDAARGRVTLVAVAFMRQPEGSADSWLGPFRGRFGTDTDYTCYELPMLEGLYARFIQAVIDRSMRASVPPEMHDRVVTYYGDADRFCEDLGIKDRGVCHAFLLDASGDVRWHGEGRASAEDLEKMLLVAREIHLRAAA